MRTTRVLIAACSLAACSFAAGCGQTNDEHVPSDGPPPISGGTLHITRDGDFAIASDPDRSSIHIVDLNDRVARHRIQLEETDEPGRITEDADGRVHVVLRRAGEVLTLDPSSGNVLERRGVCAAPRGIDVDPLSGELLVACAEGTLVRMPPTGLEGISRIRLDSDLRDVVAFGNGITLVSRFRSAEILWIEHGAIVHRERPPEAPMSFAGRAMQATVAWRLRRYGDDRAIMVHQHSQSSQLGVLGVPSGVYYGGDCSVGVVRSVVTLIDVNARTFQTAPVDSTNLAVDGDGAGRVGGGSIALAAAAEPNTSFGPGFTSTGLRVLDPTWSLETCTLGYDPAHDPYDYDSHELERPAIAVAQLPDSSGFVGQYRDPAVLRVERGSESYEIPLDAGSAQDLGHSLFHEAVGTGMTCAGCHPEGGDDGHVWLFDIGTRRTQTMTGGILETAPFHWAGDVANSTEVMDGTLVGRMGASAAPRSDEIRAFEHWIDAVPSVPGPNVGEAVDRGAIVFGDAGCTGCHSGARLTNNATMNVGTGGAFQVPSLHEVYYHAPYFHDGAAASLEDVVQEHMGGSALSSDQQTDLVSYLRSL